MSPSIDRLIAEYEDCFRTANRIEISPDRFRKAMGRGDDESWGAGALLSRDGRGLLVREADTWLLPGGRLDAGETPEAGARREVREEAGIEIEITGLGAIAEQTFVDADSGAQYECTFVTFLAEPLEPDSDPWRRSRDHSIDEVAWISTVPENTFDRDVVTTLFDAYV